MEALEAMIADATEEPALIHPNMAKVYREQVAQLTAALTDRTTTQRRSG